MEKRFLDITKLHCPMTFVKTKVELTKLNTGDQLEILVTEGEPLDNVPKTATEQGFKVLDISHVQDNIHKILIEKGLNPYTYLENKKRGNPCE